MLFIARGTVFLNITIVEDATEDAVYKMFNVIVLLICVFTHCAYNFSNVRNMIVLIIYCSRDARSLLVMFSRCTRPSCLFKIFTQPTCTAPDTHTAGLYNIS